MKRFFSNLSIGILTLAGIGLMVYPHVGFWLSQRSQSYVIEQYVEKLDEMGAETIQAKRERAHAYNGRISSPTIQGDPFAYGQANLGEEYLSLLNLNDNGMMGHIKIPKIALDAPIYHGSAESVLQVGIGHLPNSALPVGGEGTHSFLTGHTGLNTAKLFTDLVELVVGDEFYLYTLDQVLAYRVDQILVVEPTQTEALAVVEGKDLVTLITCTPYGINSHRLLVRGERVPYETVEEIEQRMEETDAVMSKELLLFIIGVAALLLLLSIAITVFLMKRSRSKSVTNDKRNRRRV